MLPGHGVQAREAGGGPGLLAVHRQGHRRVLVRPYRLDRIGNVAHGGAVPALLRGGALAAAHDLQERAPVVGPFDQREVGVELGAGDGGGIADALPPHQVPERRPVQRPHPQFPDDAVAERLHAPRGLECGDVDGGVEQGQRGDPGRDGRDQLEPDRPADVVHDQVEAAEAELVHGGQAEPPETGPAVVVATGAVGQAEARKVESHPAQAARGQFGQHLAVQERGADHAVDADDGRPVSFLAHEAGHAGGAEPAAGLLMRLEYLGAAGRPSGDGVRWLLPAAWSSLGIAVPSSAGLCHYRQRPGHRGHTACRDRGRGRSRSWRGRSIPAPRPPGRGRRVEPG